MAIALAGDTAYAGGAADLDRDVSAATSGYRSRLEELAKWCEEHGLAEQAAKTRKWLRPRDPNMLYVAVLPKTVGRPKPAADAPADVVEWDSRLARLQKQQAADLYELARRAVLADRASLAVDLLLAAVHECPDHEPVRRVLGFESYRGEWRTPEEKANLKAGMVWHDRFGWLPKTHVKRYEEGQRYHDGHWISAEEDARVHRDIRSGWDVMTDHYTIRTDLSLEGGVELGQRLEKLYLVWKQLFVRYYASESDVKSLFDTKARGRRIELPRHLVAYFRDRNDYNESLRTILPNIGISTGVYIDVARRAYFFAGTDFDARNVYHEATHQLFHESRPVADAMGRRPNYWVIEGIAMYMESLREEDGFYLLGGFNDLRIQAARYRLLHDNFYVPLTQFNALTMEQVQADPRIATLYSQAAGLTHFLVHYQGGRYRDALVQYLSNVYNGRADTTNLFQTTGASSSDLDRQYREFLQAGSDQRK